MNTALAEENNALTPGHAVEAIGKDPATNPVAVSLNTSDLMNQLVQATAPSQANGLPTVGTDRSEFETLINFFLSASATSEQDWQPSSEEEALSSEQQESQAFRRKI